MAEAEAMQKDSPWKITDEELISFEEKVKTQRTVFKYRSAAPATAAGAADNTEGFCLVTGTDTSTQQTATDSH